MQVYVNNKLNAVQTAKDLFIHRSTMTYQLERIKDIGQWRFLRRHRR
ncbi:helix-turn-helix domain-containing protein [Desulfitobacterium hafniense]|nr:helix-turn-helix domain-containing protein [Desulfitobacterium hafniense]